MFEGTKRRIALTAAVAASIAVAAGAGTLLEELPVKPGGLLEVELHTGGDIEVIGWDQDLVRVETERGGEGGPEVEVEATANGVRIESLEHRRWGDHDGSVELRVRVPRRFDVDLETVGGTIRLRGLEGRLRGETMGGELELSDLHGELDLTTMGGEIELRGSNVSGEVKTMGGEVLFEDVTGSVKGTSMGGDVVYRNVAPTTDAGGGAVVIGTMGGDIRVDRAANGAEVKTMGGEIEILSANAFVKAETMGGNIEIAAVDGWVDASTMGGNVEVTMVGDPAAGRRDVEITSHGGEIRVTVPAALAMNVDIEIAYTRGSARRYEVVSDWPLTVSESPDWERGHGDARKRIRATGVVGAGTHRVRIRTINGDVHLKKGGAG